DVLLHEIRHRGAPLLDERHVARVQLALALDQPAGEALERAHEERVARPEVVVDEAVVDAGFLAELARRDTGVPDVDEHPLRRVEQRLLRRHARVYASCHNVPRIFQPSSVRSRCTYSW